MIRPKAAPLGWTPCHTTVCASRSCVAMAGGVNPAALNRPIPTAETQKDGLQKDGLSFIRFHGESCRRKEGSLLGGYPCRGSLSERASKQYDSVYPTFWKLLQPRL